MIFFVRSSSFHIDSLTANHNNILSTKEEIGSYAEQHTFTNGCLRNGMCNVHSIYVLIDF